MRTTIDIPDKLAIEAKKLAAEQQKTLKEVFKEALETYLKHDHQPDVPPWKMLKGKGRIVHLKAGDSGFEGYEGPDLLSGIGVNEPSDR